MEDESLCYMSATEMAKMIRKKKVSPVEIIESILARIQRLNPKINAYCTPVAEKAKKDAKNAEEMLFRKEKLGPLHKRNSHNLWI
jgi:Asp-tRNA(Asn)/Glu-tRNA(Gln) amidotransferase A subunit family amidase